MLIRRSLAPFLAVALLAVAPTAALAAPLPDPELATPGDWQELDLATPPPTPPTPPTDSGGPVAGDADVLPYGYPEAVLNAPQVVLLSGSIQFVLDASTGLDIVEQQLHLYDPAGTLVSWLRTTGPPDSGSWLNYRPTTTGAHTATLSVTTAAGYVDTTEHTFMVIQILPPITFP
jgi:hypothetical protein